MPKLGPISWRDLVAGLRAKGFDGPFEGGKHPYMVRGDISPDLLARILRQAGLTREEWLSGD